MKTFFSFLLSMTLTGCGALNKDCKGVYTNHDSQGNLKKYNEYLSNGQCVTDNMALTQWESTSEDRKNIKCAPQSLSETLVSSDNFYKYRDGKIYLDLDGPTGEYRRLTLAEGKDGKPTFTRLQGCFYVRDSQLLLDTKNAASDQYVDIPEIFTMTSTANTLALVRYDDSSDWDYRFCPELTVPDGYCDLLKSGNSMFYPTLTVAQQASVLQEALLIRKQFNYSKTSQDKFNSIWSAPAGTSAANEDYKYGVAFVVDEPRYTSQAWQDYIRGARSTMPDISSSNMPPICYAGSQTVTLANGNQGKVYGQICYENGTYTFTQ